MIIFQHKREATVKPSFPFFEFAFPSFRLSAQNTAGRRRAPSKLSELELEQPTGPGNKKGVIMISSDKPFASDRVHGLFYNQGAIEFLAPADNDKSARPLTKFVYPNDGNISWSEHRRATASYRFRDKRARVATVRLKSAEMLSTISTRAWQGRFMFSFVVFFALAAFLALPIGATNVNDTDRVDSHYLHSIAFPRQEAVGMWLPPQLQILSIRRHHNSVTRPRGSSLPADFAAEALFVPGSEEAEELARYYNVGNGGPGGLLKDQSSSTRDDHLERRFDPATIAIIIRVTVGFFSFVLFNGGCALYTMSHDTGTATRNLCYVVATLLSLFSGFGSGFIYGKFAESSGMQAVNIALGAISAAMTSAIGRRDAWWKQHAQEFEKIYAESLEEDKRLARIGRVHHDKNTGQRLTQWDLVMSHIHPIRHSFFKGYDTTIWHEVFPGGHRQHMYTLLSDPHPLRKRQCEESDTEAGEDPPEQICEDGQSEGPTGIYNSYDFTGDYNDGESLHLVVGNYTTGETLAYLEADYLAGYNSTALCDSFMSNNNTVYMGLRQIEGNGAGTYQLSQCM